MRILITILLFPFALAAQKCSMGNPVQYEQYWIVCLQEGGDSITVKIWNVQKMNDAGVTLRAHKDAEPQMIIKTMKRITIPQPQTHFNQNVKVGKLWKTTK